MDGLQQIPLDKIEPSKTNPRRTFDKDALAELAESVKAKGVLQPILVRPIAEPCSIYKVRARKKPLSETLAPDPVKDQPPWEVICTEVKAGDDPVAGAMFEKVDAEALASECNLAEGKRRAKTFEIVAGERRWRAAKVAALGIIPAIVRDMSDREVLEVQVTENEVRSDLSPLEKAAGYQRLLDEDYTVEDLAAKIGKAETTIRALLKLLVLPKTARKAVEDGTLSMSTAELIARIPNDKLREECAKEVLEGENRFDGTPMSYRQAKDHIGREYMIELKQAPFSKERADLLPRAGACTSCPKQAGNNRDEFPDARADMCMDPGCFREKVKAHETNLLQLAKDSGKKILSTKEAKDLFNQWRPSTLAHNAPYIDLADTCNEWNGKRTINKGWKKLVGKQLEAEVVVAVDPEGGIHELVPKTKALAILKKDHGVKDTNGDDARYKRQQAAANKKAKEAKAAARLAILVVADKAKQAFGGLRGVEGKTTELIRSLVGMLADHSWHDACRLVATCRGLEKDADQGVNGQLADLAASMSGVEALTLFAELVTARIVGSWGAVYHGQADFEEKAFYATWGIDPKKLREVAASKSGKPIKNGREKAARCEKCKATFIPNKPDGKPRTKCPSCSNPIGGDSSPFPSLEETLEQESDDDALDEGIRQVLEHYQGSKSRWVEIAAQGASDDDLQEAIGEAFGVGSTSMQTTDGTMILCRDKPELALWFDAQHYNGKPTLRGKSLIDRVRQLYSISKPAKKRATAKA